MNSILITGASGFIGRALCNRLLRDGLVIRGTILPSDNPDTMPRGVEPVLIDPIGPDTDWSQALKGVNTVIHLAARVHIMRDTSQDPVMEFRIVNTEGTASLARQAASAGVQRFVFMSSIGVNGDNSGSKSFTEHDEPQPHNPYTISKYEAEKALWQISLKTGLAVVVIRAPLVYGPGNPGNFFSLLKIVSKGVPLPLASVQNRRSLLYIDNLVDALKICAAHPAAAGKTYLVSDGEDVSTPELIRRIAATIGRPARLLPFPPTLIRTIARMVGKSKVADSLLGSLLVDSGKIQRELRWNPPFTMADGLKETGDWFKKNFLT